MTSDFELCIWKDNSIYFGMKKRFADQAAGYYQETKDNNWIPTAGLQLFYSEYCRPYCHLNTASDMQMLLKAGFKNLTVEPEYIFLWHRSATYLQSYPITAANGFNHLLKMFDGSSYDERYQRQLPFRLAWEEELLQSNTASSPVPSDPVDLDSTILRVIGQERLCLRAYLETSLGISPATVSRAVKRLIEYGLAAEKTVSEGPGRPTGLLYLTEMGRSDLVKQGIVVVSADPEAEQAMGERIFHQRIAAAFVKTFPDASIQRAYSNCQVVPVETPLGSIVPDLIVKIKNGQVFLIEAESGKYDLKRLREKMDKYLASSCEKVYVISENQNGQTWNHLTTWVNERKLVQLEGVSENKRLQVWHTTQDLIQRHGPTGNIWRILSFSTERSRELQPIPAVPVSPAIRIKSADVIAAPAAPQAEKIAQEVNRIWKENKSPTIAYDYHLVHGKPVILRGDQGEELARLEADWIAYESDKSLDDPHETDWSFPTLYLDRVFFSYFVDPLWTVDQIRKAFQKMDLFIQNYISRGKDPTEYTTLCPADYPELYGMFVLVHTRPGDDDPAVLSKLYAPWRQVVRERMLDKYAYFPRVAVIPLNRLLKTTELRQVTDYAYDLLGYC